MMNTVTCEYCETEQEKVKRCKKCGAPLPENVFEKQAPFYYGGFMIWPERDYACDKCILHIWQGTQRIRVLEFTSDGLHSLVPEGQDFMPLIMNMIILTDTRSPIH